MGTWNLIIEDDAGKTIVIPLSRDVITIGRKEGNTIRLTERNVSRFHARLVRDSGNVFIEDLKSFNGIKLNGDKIQGRVSIQEGDLIEIGDYHLALQAHGATEPALGGAGSGSASAEPVGMKSGHLSPSTSEDNDQFAGDTQRWEPTLDLNTHEGAVATQEDPRHLKTSSAEAEHTMPAPLSGSDFHPTIDEKMPVHVAAVGDTERLQLEVPPPPKAPLAPAHSWPPPPAPLERNDLRPPTVEVGGGQPPVMMLPMSEAASTADTLIEPLPSFTPATPVVREALAPAAGVRVADAPAAQSGPATVRIPGRGREESETIKAATMAVVDDALASPRLVVLNTVFAGSTFPIRGAETVLGRTEDNDVTIEHRSVSRNHAKVLREGDRLRIVDLKSANGVLVNGEEVAQALLRSGDVIELGRVRLRYVPPGERFVVPPDEIERARIADQAGDENFDDTATHVTTTALRSKLNLPTSKKSGGPSTMVIGASAVAAAALILGGALWYVKHKQAPAVPPVEPAPVPVAVVQPPPVDVKPVPPVEVKTPTPRVEPKREPPPEVKEPADPGQVLVEQMRAHLKNGRYRDVLAVYDEVKPGTPSFMEAATLQKQAKELGALDAISKAEKAKRGSKQLENAIDELRSFAPDHERLPELEARLEVTEGRPRQQPKLPAGTPETPTALYDRANALLISRGEPKLGEAVDLLRRAIQLQPDFADPHRALATAYGRQGNFLLAVRECKKYLDLSPSAPDAPDVRAMMSKYEQQLR